MIDYTFGQFVIGYAVPNSDEKPPMHIEKLLLEMDKEPALKNILYIEVDERVTSKRGAKRRTEMMDYTFGQFVIGYAVHNSDEKPPMHIEKLLLEMDKEPALKNILYIEVDERVTSKRGAKRRIEMMDYTFGQFVIGYAVPNSDEKPPMHIENLLLKMDKEPALEHILYTE
ncbi:hypothetical protein LWI29_033699 [Acer saccharum]|uniref:Uncharacterized protein n=1 Tax=Acer saccharum TaxID=4024 RepID=A0AA39RTF8_ACESA|nr:hypothetical protein LWI29_033699 [Acer saccharum]